MAAIMLISCLFIYSFDKIIKLYTVILIYILLTNEKPLKVNEYAQDKYLTIENVYCSFYNLMHLRSTFCFK